jgi:hypothetical protein
MVTFFKISTDISVGSLVIPVNSISEGSFPNIIIGSIPSINQPIDLTNPQS